MRQMVASSLLCVCFFAPATLVGCASPPERRTPMMSAQPATDDATSEPATQDTTQASTQAASEPATEPTTGPTTTTAASRGPSTASARPQFWLRKPATVTIEANDFEQLWRACEESARHFGFVLDRQDYRGGVITTQPLTSKQFFEFWRNDVATLDDLAKSSLSTYRRTLRFDIEKTAAGGYAASPRVVIERYARSETPITASVYLRNAFRSQRGTRTWGSPETDRGVYIPRQYWYATGRDDALEKNVGSEMRKQLARMQRKHGS